MIRATHEIHDRRRSRNLGLGLVLIAFVGIVFGMTIVKVGNGEDVLGTGMVTQEAGQ
ncbi:hypothetical protein CLV78_102258 [Aliiruegeria haliotis]|uniref:Uncharacterized protein n=1 Tax=Aliiruegeria haliotis TaxID=1280846 RepID=A0A2T0RV73_9RHOB|nr:hypothetical protein [Aliiruegeria haliotis]PRY25081.1 hypothetical protein CLV78_102258 [Aliiruegeria haliotis]